MDNINSMCIYCEKNVKNIYRISEYIQNILKLNPVDKNVLDKSCLTRRGTEDSAIDLTLASPL